MSVIVNDAKPIATDAILRRFVVFDLVAQKKLATWLALQAMMADLIAKEPVKLPRSDLDYLYRNKEPPPEMFIGIGCYAGPPHVGFDHTSVPLWDDTDLLAPVLKFSIHTMTSIIGCLYAIRSRANPALTKDTPIRMYSPYLVQLWPPAHPSISWPSPLQFWIHGFLSEGGLLARELAIKLGRDIHAELERLKAARTRT